MEGFGTGIPMSLWVASTWLLFMSEKQEKILIIKEDSLLSKGI